MSKDWTNLVKRHPIFRVTTTVKVNPIQYNTTNLVLYFSLFTLELWKAFAFCIRDIAVMGELVNLVTKVVPVITREQFHVID